MKRLIIGEIAVKQALDKHGPAIQALYFSKSFDGKRAEASPLAARAKSFGIRVDTRPDDEVRWLANQMQPTDVVAVAGEYPYANFEDAISHARTNAPYVVLALDQISDPHNFGAIIRSAAAMGVTSLVTLRHRSCPVTAAVVRTSTGATERVAIARVPNLASALSKLSEEGFRVLGLDAAAERSVSQTQSSADMPVVLVVGSEGSGLRRLTRTRCDELIRIPMSSGVSSLNASVATAIALFAITTTHRR